jgi:RNA polymerase sigma-70 factor, ECF subfamily
VQGVTRRCHLQSELGVGEISNLDGDSIPGVDAAAIDQLFRPCIPRLRKAAARLLRNPYDAEDALQDGLLSAFRHLDQFQGRAQFMTWMHSIVTNAARSKLRREQSRPLLYSLDEPSSTRDNTSLADTIADPRSNLDDQYTHIERRQILTAALRELPAKWRAILVLCDIEGYRLKEAAAKLGLSESAVKTGHFRANRLLQKRAKEVQTRTKFRAQFK